jgi:hypothetical protein
LLRGDRSETNVGARQARVLLQSFRAPVGDCD